MAKSCAISFNIQKRNILLCGDVELKADPITSKTNNDLLLNYRMFRHGLRPLDVGGAGDCFLSVI